MEITYKFRLYPTKEKVEKLSFILELCRWLYNTFLAMGNSADKIPSRFKLQAMLPRIKEEKPELKGVNAKALQMVLFMLYRFIPQKTHLLVGVMNALCLNNLTSKNIKVWKPQKR